MTIDLARDRIARKVVPVAEKTSRDLSLEDILHRQKQAFLDDGTADLAIRLDRLDRLGALLADRAEELTDALTADYGSRARVLSMSGDVQACLIDIAEQRRHVRHWMRESVPSRLLSVAGIHARVRNDPLGVVGVLGPWNFPLQLAITPASAAIAAGNRVMIRPSSVTYRTTEVLARHAPDYFDVEELAIITREHGSGSDFSKLKFDSLFFTGSPEVGASVAADAAANLVPVTLELGGKNPVVVDQDANIDRAAKLIAQARLTNSGQVCLCPDYVFVPERSVDTFVDAVLKSWRSMFPAITGNPDYTSIVNTSNYDRVNALVADAVALGATATAAVPRGESLPDDTTRKIAPTVLTGVRPGMKIEETEVFGPVLTVYPYTQLSQPIDFINRHDHPLTLYWHGPRNDRFDRVVASTRSGSVQGNDFLLNMLPALPFGGVGKSGMGNYHGKYGFATFTHQRSVAHSSTRLKFSAGVVPPYGWFKRTLQQVTLLALQRRYRPVKRGSQRRTAQSAISRGGLDTSLIGCSSEAGE